MDSKVNLIWKLLLKKVEVMFLLKKTKKAKLLLEPFLSDSIYTPIKNVKYSIENFRVEQKTDYEKLVFEIITDGSIHPKDALTEAAKTLIHHFMLFSDERITLRLMKLLKLKLMMKNLFI